MKNAADGELTGWVSFSSDAPLKPWREGPRQYVQSVEGTICVGREGDAEVAGTLKLLVIKYAEAINQGVPLRKVFRSHSPELHDAYVALFDGTDDFKEVLSIEAIGNEVLYLEAVSVEPTYRNGFLTAQAIETAIATHASMGVAVARRETLPVWQWRQLGFRRVMGTGIVFRDDAGAIVHV
jgi:hypothetical protein